MQQESIDRVVGHQNDRPGGQKGQLLVQYQHAALDTLAADSMPGAASRLPHSATTSSRNRPVHRP